MDYKDNAGKWIYSTSGEAFSPVDAFDTREEAIQAARAEQLAFPDQFYVGRIRLVGFSELHDTADSFIESMQERLYEIVGEFSENFSPDVTQEEALGRMLERTVDQWATIYEVDLGCYNVVDIELVEGTA